MVGNGFEVNYCHQQSQPTSKHQQKPHGASIPPLLRSPQGRLPPGCSTSTTNIRKALDTVKVSTRAGDEDSNEEEDSTLCQPPSAPTKKVLHPPTEHCLLTNKAPAQPKQKKGPATGMSKHFITSSFFVLIFNTYSFITPSGSSCANKKGALSSCRTSSHQQSTCPAQADKRAGY